MKYCTHLMDEDTEAKEMKRFALVLTMGTLSEKGSDSGFRANVLSTKQHVQNVLKCMRMYMRT